MLGSPFSLVYSTYSKMAKVLHALGVENVNNAVEIVSQMFLIFSNTSVFLECKPNQCMLFHPSRILEGIKKGFVINDWGICLLLDCTIDKCLNNLPGMRMEFPLAHFNISSHLSLDIKEFQ